jgi:hypothetical protein
MLIRGGYIIINIIMSSIKLPLNCSVLWLKYLFLVARGKSYLFGVHQSTLVNFLYLPRYHIYLDAYKNYIFCYIKNKL